MSSNLCAIVSDSIDAEVLSQIESTCGSIMTQSEVETAENATFDKLNDRIAKQKANGETGLAAIKGRAIEIHGAKQLPDGSVQVALAVNMSILFNIEGTGTNLETGETFEAMYRYARTLLKVTPSLPDGQPNAFYNQVLGYAQDIAKNPKAEFQPNGSLDLRKAGRGSGLYQMVAAPIGDEGYIAFALTKSVIGISDGVSYQLKDVDLYNVMLTTKTSTVNITEFKSYGFRKAHVAPVNVVNNNVNKAEDMIIPAKAAAPAPVKAGLDINAILG